MTDAQPGPGGVDSGVPAPARIYDYLLAGSNNFPADRAAAEQILKAVPEVRDAAWSNRGFHQRAAKWIAEQGIRQFVNIGSGLPTVGNTHEVVQRLVPEARVVYVDNDPLVRLHSEPLLADNGSTTVILGDLREPESILGNPELRRLIDFSEPAGLLMTGVLMFVADEAGPYQLVARYVRRTGPGQLPVAVAPQRRSQVRSGGGGIPRRLRHRHRAHVLPVPGRGGPVLHRPGTGAAVPGQSGRADLCRPVGRRGPGRGRHRWLPLAVVRGRPATGGSGDCG